MFELKTTPQDPYLELKRQNIFDHFGLIITLLSLETLKVDLFVPFFVNILDAIIDYNSEGVLSSEEINQQLEDIQRALESYGEAVKEVKEKIKVMLDS